MPLHSPFFFHLFLTKIWRYIKDKYISTLMKFSCLKCNFKTNDGTKYERHCKTKKHLNNLSNTYIFTDRALKKLQHKFIIQMLDFSWTGNGA